MPLDHIKRQSANLGAYLKYRVGRHQMAAQNGQGPLGIRYGQRPCQRAPKERRRYLDGRDASYGEFGAIHRFEEIGDPS
jgi:hypothetical protein